MENINSYCSICGKGYHLCMTCRSRIKSQPWTVYTDTSEHYKIFLILSAYNSKVYDKEEAKKRLLNVDLSDIENFKDIVKNTIREILDDNAKTTTKKAKKTINKKAEPLIESDENNELITNK